MENSIEEDIARIAKLITTKFNNDYSIDNKDKEAIEHILSDYKKVLKENESLQKTYDDCYCRYKHYMQFESISKTKIEDMIAEIEADKLNYSEDDWYLESDVKGYAIDKLKELLESEENR